MLKTLAKLTALAAWGWVGSAHALGLGEIEVQSRLNQPLAALIPVSSATPRELESLSIELASNEDFERAGMERAEFLSSLRFELKDNVIRIVSKDLAREPFVSFLLDLRWEGGRLLREYTVLLDLPASEQARAQPTPVAPAPVEKPMARAPPAGDPADRPAAPADTEPAPPASAEPVDSAGGDETYGPVQPKETLWSIAYMLRRDPALTMDQMQVAIFEANPAAFEDGKLTGLMKGSFIRIPSADEIRSVDPASAKAQVMRANRSPGRAAVAPPPAKVVDERPPAAVVPVEAAPTPAPEPEPTPEPTPEPADRSAPPAESPAAPVIAPPADQPPPPATDSGPAVEPADPSQMVDEPAPAPPEGVETTPLPAPVAASPPAAAEPGLLENVLGIKDHPLFLPVAAGLVLLLIAVVAGRKLRERYAQWQYERASRQATTAPEPTPAAEPAPAAVFSEPMPAPEAARASPFAAAPDNDRTLRAPEPRMAATANQAPLAQTLAQTQGQTQAQTMQQTLQTQAHPQAVRPSQTQAIEPAAARSGGAPKVDFDVSGTYATETVQINLDAGDPVSEAEFHRAYGLYDEAALLLKQALEKDPKRTEARVKLAEIYFEANKAAEFIEVAKQLKKQLPEGEWQKIALLGSQIAAGNELFSGASTGGTVDLSFDDPAPAPAAPAARSASAPKPAPPAVDDGMLNFTLDEVKVDSPSPAPAAAPAAVVDGGLEFSLDSLSLDAPVSAASSPGKPAPATGGVEFKMEELSLGDFDTKTEAAAPAAGGLELGGELSIEAAPAGGDESSTKLDLARAYLDMGDNDMAKSLLNEVQKQGNAQQKKEAQELLSRVAA